ncbi:alpha/beta hydrolase [Prauserella alba]|uniref:Alpha/beta hydrolase n=1 Tax=Prauserella alba TaxID=176898 RepID=A0ABP4G5T7_9PSEU|nr:alpha/beta hydrolase [Prauserella alba]MCP2182142.1 acetyl esterase [Prauserella alba]
MPLDPAVQELLNGLQQQGFQSFEKVGVAATREAVESFVGLQKPGPQVSRVVDVSYGDEAGQCARIYVPDTGTSAPLPVVFYAHGGGFVGGDLDVVDSPARFLADDLGAIVVTVTYRRAPEAKFPAAHDDVFAALQWVGKEIGSYGGDPERLAVLGDSVGGNLVVSAALRARETGGPDVAAHVMVYPLIDPAADTASRREYAEGYIIHLAALEWFRAQYVNGPDDVADPRLNIAGAPSLGSLAPTLILTNEYDTLRDEAEQFGDSLRKAGAEATVRRFDGLVHGVFWMSGAVPRSEELHRAAVDFLRDRLR